MAAMMLVLESEENHNGKCHTYMAFTVYHMRIFNMNYKIKKAVILSIMSLICFGLIGCQKTPKAVTKRMSEYGANHQMKSETLTFCTIDELRDTRLSDLDIETENIDLPDKTDFSDIEEIGTINAEFDYNALNRAQTYLETFDIGNDVEPSESYINTGDKMEIYDDKSNNFLEIGNNGFLYYQFGISYYMMNNDVKQTITAKYDIDSADISNTTIKLKSGTVSLKKICNNAQSWMENNFREKECTYRVSDIWIKKIHYDEIDANQIMLLMEARYKGVPFNTYGTEVTTKNNKGKVSLMIYDINMSYDDSLKLTDFSNGSGHLTIKKYTKIDQVLDLKSAIKIVNEKMSGFNKLKVNKIIPLYALFPQYDTDKESFSKSGQGVLAKPVYAFIIPDDTMDDENATEIYKSNSCKYIFVDMVTGELTTNIGEQS